jgi:hypothetical protein
VTAGAVEATLKPNLLLIQGSGSFWRRVLDAPNDAGLWSYVAIFQKNKSIHDPDLRENRNVICSRWKDHSSIYL